MVSSRFAALALIGTLVGSAVAQFEIFAPGGPDVWWGTWLTNCVPSF